MARACGIRLGSQTYELVVLEGSAKSPKLIACRAGEFAAGEDPVQVAAQALREVAREARAPADNVGLAVDTGLAAFRGVTLPFADRAKIEEVLKYEVESQLPHWSVDDVVVDFLVLRSSQNESKLMAAAVRKEALEPALKTCELAGLDAIEAELEITSVLNTAHRAGLLSEDSAQVLIHVGEASTSIAVVDGGLLKIVRAVRIGALPPRAAVAAEATETAAGAAENADAAPTVPAATADGAGADAGDLAERLQRDLARTMFGLQTEKPIEAIYLCGQGGAELLGEQAFGYEVRRLSPFEPGADAAADPGRFAAAYGAALRRLGAPWQPFSLRREELRYAGKFERLELPLAVVGLLAVALLAVHLILTNNRILGREQILRTWIAASNNYLIGPDGNGVGARLKRPPPKIKDYCLVAQKPDGDPDRNEFERIQNIRLLLNNEIRDLKKKLGHDNQIVKPQSALEGMAQVLLVMEGMGDQIGRVGIRRLDATYVPGRAGRPDGVQVKLDLTFFGEDDLVATRHYNDFANEMKSKPWCTDFDPSKNEALDNGKGIAVDGISVLLDLSRLERAEGAQG